MSKKSERTREILSSGSTVGPTPLVSSSNIKINIWTSKISWRIALAVFMTILAVQIATTYFAAVDYKNFILESSSQIASSALTPLLKPASLDMTTAIMDRQEIFNVMRDTNINGFAVYRLDGKKIEEYGELTSLKPDTNVYNQNKLSNDFYYYERVLNPTELKRPYHVAVKLNTTRLREEMRQYVLNAVIVILLLSIFVTIVLMVLLGEQLLKPIMLLRHNLIRSARDPENPQNYMTRSYSKDEIGIVIEAANNLIRRNASTLSQLKNKSKETIHQLAYYDTLTGLPNRTFFLRLLQKAIQDVKNQDNKVVAVAVLDLDHFKDINDSLGYQVGDQLLTAVGQRIKGAVPSDYYVSRSGEDEFVVAATIKKEEAENDQLAKIIFKALKNPFSVLNERVQIYGSVGIAYYPKDGSEAIKLLKNADIALNRAKKEGRDTVRSYKTDFDKEVRKRFEMVRCLREAIEKEELQLYYQPQLDLKTGKIIGAEALVRWWMKDQKGEKEPVFVSPGEFIPLAEQSGLIIPLGRWVIKEACRQNKSWQAQGFPFIRVAVNISAIQFQQSDFVDYVGQVLHQSKLDPSSLELEVTEGVFMDDINQTIRKLQELNNFGVELAIDDFGTGYSSLSYLRKFPIDRLKIDQSFVRDLNESEDDSVIIRTIIKLGHELGIRVMAEGVETKEHETFLREHDCDEAQGYYYAKPMPSVDFEKFLNEKSIKQNV